jgi:hypothetical protein
MHNVKLRRAWEWITEVGKAGWIITSVVLLVALVGLCFNITSYNIQSRTDHASLHTMQISLSSPAADATHWMQSIQNSGREDAIDVKLQLGTIDANTKSTRLLETDDWVRIGNGGTAYSDFYIYKKDFLDFFVTCLTYRDGRGQTGEELFFYQLPVVPLPNMGAAPKLVAANEQKKLSSEFSCAKL